MCNSTFASSGLPGIDPFEAGCSGMNRVVVGDRKVPGEVAMIEEGSIIILTKPRLWDGRGNPAPRHAFERL